MSGLNWVSYTSSSLLDAGYYSLTLLYANIINFFATSTSQISSGTVTSLQLNGSGTDNPIFSTFSLGPTTNIAIKFTGYFCPNQTGSWTIHLGYNLNTPCDDAGILFLGLPDTPITPNATFSSTSGVPSSTLPVIYNLYNSANNSVTLNLSAGVNYPILIYYSQGRYSYTLGLSFAFNGGTLITDFTNYTSTTASQQSNLPCFIKGTKILTDKGYRLIEDLRNGDLIKTIKHDYKPIDMIGKRDIYHSASQERINDQLYKCSPNEYPELFEDLILTGGHSILVDQLTPEEKEKTKEALEILYLTDGKYCLLASIDNRASVYETPGTYTIYHLALENDDYYMNYGIYANGLLVESCTKQYLKEFSNMTIIE